MDRRAMAEEAYAEYVLAEDKPVGPSGNGWGDLEEDSHTRRP